MESLKEVWANRGVREAAGTIVWTVCTTSLFLFSQSDSYYRQRMAEVVSKDWLLLFLSMLLPFIALVELFGVTFAALVNPSFGIAFSIGGLIDGWLFLTTLFPAQIVGHVVGVQILRRTVPTSLLERKLLDPPSPPLRVRRILTLTRRYTKQRCAKSPVLDSLFRSWRPSASRLALRSASPWASCY